LTDDLLDDIRDELAGYPHLSKCDEQLPHITLFPPLKKLGPNLLDHYVVATRLWGFVNGLRYYNILEWEIAHRRKGENAPNWKGGKSFEPYCPKFNKELKEKVREAFGRKCLVCGKTEFENRRRLAIHHVNYDKEQGCRGKSWLLVPLCSNCHTKTNNDRVFWEEKISEILRGLHDEKP
jgi:hypothetical protein